MTTSSDTAALTEHLVGIPSPSGQEHAVLDAVERWCGTHRVQVRRVPVEGDRSNLLVGHAPTTRALLTTHIDTVPGGPRPERRGEELIGRGVCDAKGIAAAMLGALLDLRAVGQHDVAVLLVVGEETSSDGARAAAQALPPVSFVINGEPTEMRFVQMQRGALAARLEARGVAVHSGYPDRGRSALHSLLDALTAIRAEPWPRDPVVGETLVNIGTLHGGSAPNVLAEAAQAELMMRVAVSADAVESRLRSLIGPNVTLEVRSKSDPQRLLLPPGREGVVVGFASDVAHLRPLGPVIMVGPGSILDAHTDHERIRIADLELARALYADLCQELLRGDTP